MSEWKEYILSDVAVIKNGFAFKGTDFIDNGIPVIKIKNVKPNKILLDNLAYVSKETAIGKEYYKIKPTDILVTMSGNRADGSPDSWVGKVALFKLNGDFLLNQRVSALQINNEICSTEFIAYNLSSWDTQLHLINEANSSGGQANISPEIIKRLKLNLPPLPEQTAIASVLCSLDDKIDLLHRQNATLEKMAETLFRQRFVEEAKEEWEDVELGQLLEINGGFSYKGEFIGNGESLLLGMGCVSFHDRFLTTGARPYSGDCHEKYLVNPGDLVIATRQQSDNLPILGFPAIIPPEFSGKKVIVGANLYRVRNNTKIDNYLFYLILRSAEYRQHILASSKGSTVRMITKDAIEKYKIALPSSEVIENLIHLLKPINEKSITNQSQIRTLTALRDTLLPKLMSGEVKVEVE